MAYFKIGGIGGNPLRDCVDPSQIKLEPSHTFSMGWFNKCNSMHLYRGERPSECHLLVTKETLDSLNPTTATYHQVEVSDGRQTFLTRRWMLDHVEAIGQNESIDQIFYIVLKDVRNSKDYLEATHFDIVSTTWEENLTAGWPSDSTNYTWAFVLGIAYQAMPIILRADSQTTPVLPFVPASLPRNIRCEGESSWQCICRLLAACGCVGNFDSTTGMYQFLAYDGIQNGLANLYATYENQLVWDAECPASLNTAHAPNFVRVHFRTSRRCVSLLDGGTKTSFGESYRINTGYTSTATNSEYGIVDTARVRYSADENTILNLTELNNRLTDLTRTVKGKTRAASSRSMKVYQGVCPFKPGEEVTHVVFKSDKRYGITTTVEQWEPFEIKLPQVVHAQPDICRIAYGKTTTTISGRSGDALGAGTVRLRDASGNALASNEYTITVYNVSAVSIPSDTWVVVGQEFIDRTWTVLVEACS